MPVTKSSYGERTPAEDVVTSFASQVKGKIVLVTGPNANGIGGSTTLALATGSPRILIMAGRTPSKFDGITVAIQAIDPNIVVKTVKVDLSSTESCKAAAQHIMHDADIPQIDIVINNAGIMNTEARELTSENIEQQFASNYLGHFILTNGIMAKILKSAEHSPKGSTRIINVSSSECYGSPIRFSDINIEKSTTDLPEAERPDWNMFNGQGVIENGSHTGRVAYSQSKTAAVLFSVELNKLLFTKYGVLSAALHPGTIGTEIGRSMDSDKLEDLLAYFEQVGMYLKTLSEGASTTLVAALDPNISPSDVYLSDCQVAEARAWCTDPSAAAKLWELGEKYAGQTFRY